MEYLGVSHIGVWVFSNMLQLKIYYLVPRVFVCAFFAFALALLAPSESAATPIRISATNTARLFRSVARAHGRPVYCLISKKGVAAPGYLTHDGKKTFFNRFGSTKDVRRLAQSCVHTPLSSSSSSSSRSESSSSARSDSSASSSSSSTPPPLSSSSSSSSSQEQSSSRSAADLPPIIVPVRTPAQSTLSLPLQFEVRAEAPDHPGRPIAFEWTTLSGPMPAVFSNPGHAQTSASFPAIGNYVIAVRATSGLTSAVLELPVSISADPCLDGLDNDDDGLPDWPLDPECATAQDQHENTETISQLDLQFGNGLIFVNGQPRHDDGLIRALNFQPDSAPHDPIPVVGYSSPPDQSTPAGNPLRIFLHSLVRLQGNPEFQGGPELVDGAGRRTSLTHFDLEYTVTPHNPTRVDLATQGPDFHVLDRISVHSDTIYIASTISNERSETMTLELPFFLGGLQLGAIDGSGSDISRFRAAAQGIVQSSFDYGGSEVHYPLDIDTFSPVTVLWDQQLTIGAQLLSEIDLPDWITFVEFPYPRSTSGALMRQTLHVELGPRAAKTFVLAYRVSRTIPEDTWKPAIEPYRNWFRRHFGTHPSYCPTGAFIYGHGYNSPRYVRDPASPLYNLFLPDTSLDQAIASPQAISFMGSSGVQLFGVWGTTQRWQDVADRYVRFEPRIDLLDANLYEASRPEALSNFLSNFSAHGVTPFWFSRPCLDVVGARIDYAPDGTYSITRGQVHGNDLSEQADFDRAIATLDVLVRAGVGGFYLDAFQCNGATTFPARAQEIFRIRYGRSLTMILEGAQDRRALLYPQIPILNSRADGNLLPMYIVPEATYYGGVINAVLDDAAFDRVIDQGFQAIPLNFAWNGPNVQIADRLRRSRINQHARWEAYGQAMNCPAPPQ